MIHKKSSNGCGNQTNSDNYEVLMKSGNIALPNWKFFSWLKKFGNTKGI